MVSAPSADGPFRWKILPIGRPKHVTFVSYDETGGSRKEGSVWRKVRGCGGGVLLTVMQPYLLGHVERCSRVLELVA